MERCRGLSVLGMRWDTSSLPDDVAVREAIVEVRSTYRGAPGAEQETRSLGLQWRTAKPGRVAGGRLARIPLGDRVFGEPNDRCGRGTRHAVELHPVEPEHGVAHQLHGTLRLRHAEHVAGRRDLLHLRRDVVRLGLRPERICVGELESNAGSLCPLGDECTGGAICLSAPACGSGPNKGSPCSVDDDCPQGDCLAADGAPRLHVYHCIPTPNATPASTRASTPIFPPTMTPSPAASPSATPSQSATCAGDCDGSGNVAINELILGVSIAQGVDVIDRCLAFDSSGDSRVEISELIAAVTDTLGGCS